MKLLRETVNKEISLPKHKTKNHSTRKTIGCFAKTIGCFAKTIGCFAKTISCLYQFTNNKTEFKEIKDREKAHRGLYWFTLNPELHPVFPETTGESTKQSTLDHL